MKKNVSRLAAAGAALGLLAAFAQKSSAAGASDQVQRLIAVLRAAPGVAGMVRRQSAYAAPCMFAVSDGETKVYCEVGNVSIPTAILADQNFVKIGGSLYDWEIVQAAGQATAFSTLNNALVTWGAAGDAMRQFSEPIQVEAERVRAVAQEAAAQKMIDQIARQ